MTLQDIHEFYFLNLKMTIYKFVKFSKKIEYKKDFSIINIKSDHDGEFLSDLFEILCEEKRYHHNFSTFRTLQQNGVVERKKSVSSRNDKNCVK
jgi:sensor histidine kinase YesM